jgi:peptidoglycan/LPS O-acetylase OafA/YrhL
LQGERTERFAGLDLLRGIAALAVLLIHSWSLPFSSWRPLFLNPFPRAYLAVDLFFVLSGFVLAHAYHHRLASRDQLKQYCLARFIRLYPLYCATILMAAAEMLAVLWFGHGADPRITAHNLLVSFSTAIFFLPTPDRWSVAPPLLFPLAFTAWSLFWELLVNLLYGLTASRLGEFRLLVPLAIGALLLGIAVAGHGRADLGGFWPGAWHGGARALFSFFAGVAVFRLRKKARAPSVPAPILVLALLLAMIPASFGGGVYDLACVALLFPLLVWMGAEATMGPRLRFLALLAGYLSYPVYLLQGPLLWAFPPLSVRLQRALPSELYRQIALQICPAVVVGFSWIVAKAFDSPVREWLRRRFLHHPANPRAQTVP